VHPVALIALVLILARLAAQLWLARLNRLHVQANAETIPPAFVGVVDPATYAKSVAYTIAKSDFGWIELVFDAAILVVVLFSGILPRWFNIFASHFGTAPLAMALFLFSTGVLLSIPSLPLDWYSQFKLEERFGFNTTTPKLWLIDRLKGLVIGALLGIPLIWLILKLVDWIGPLWWLWAWVALLAFQFLMAVLVPFVVMPLFNKFTPLPAGSLRDRLLALGSRTGFQARAIQVMDGSKRSRHSNAFFAGFGRFRKIVLFDTLVSQLTEPELEAVLAHEIGHYKKRHIPKMLAVSAAGLFLMFCVISWLTTQTWFFQAFGFKPGLLAPALLLFSLLAGVIGFWFTPVSNILSRKFEYEADAYAAAAMNETASITGALRKLNEKNLSNLTPHPLYSGFYYSHPTLLERERALSAALVSGGQVASPGL
jgi:STE24 endopeptidase